MFLNDAVYFMDNLSKTAGVYTYDSNIQYSTTKILQAQIYHPQNITTYYYE